MKKKTYKTVESLIQAMNPDMLPDVQALRANQLYARTLMSMRIHAGLTQADMARLLDCSQPRISNLESTTNDNIGIQDILNYCRYTGKPFECTDPVTSIPVRIQGGATGTRHKVTAA